MRYRYFFSGSESEKEGLTYVKFSYYDDGTLAAGVENTNSIYKGREVTEEEYNLFLQRLRNPDTKLGIAGGIVNEEGWRKVLNFIEKQEKARAEAEEKQIALSAKKIKKMLDLGIIDENDVDTEIDQQKMCRFKTAIKERISAV